MRLYLLHHADAVGPQVDPQRPLSADALAHATRLAALAKDAGCAPVAIWHSGKLRARQTAEAFYRACNPFADFKMVRGLLPEDPPHYLRELIAGETRDVLAAGHMPNLRDSLLAIAPGSALFPLHGVVALERQGDSGDWRELWRLS